MADKRVEGGEIYGVNPVTEALKSGKPLRKILVSERKRGSGPMKTLLQAARERDIPIHWQKEQELERLTGTRSHQGVVGVGESVKTIDLDSLIEKALAHQKDPVIVLLDGVEDPGNLGAIIRSAEVLGIYGIVIPKDRASGVTATVVKRSAGAAEHLPIARVTNLSEAIKALKEKGFWIAGLEKGGEKLCYEGDYKGPMGIVIGGEGKGMRRLVKENCDFIVSIPMKGKVTSLNASAAASIIFYEVLRQRS